MRHLILVALISALILPAAAVSPVGAQDQSDTTVYSSDKAIGQDPDPNVRMQILRDKDHEDEN